MLISVITQIFFEKKRTKISQQTSKLSGFVVKEGSVQWTDLPLKER